MIVGIAALAGLMILACHQPLKRGVGGVKNLSPVRGERSECEAIRVRGPIRDSERQSMPHHPDLLPARGEKGKLVRRHCSESL